MQIKVSVLIYVRNDRHHIRESVKSVMNQTLKEIEILAIDGGSTDGTFEILEEMANQDSRIRILHTIPSVGAQFNLGLQEAKGEYIGICESDDYILPNMYEIQYGFAKENCLDILKADFNRFCGNGEDRVILPFHVLASESLYGKIFRPRDDDNMTKMGITSFWSGLYRRDFLLDGQIFMNETGGASYQDTSFAFLSLYKAERVMFIRRAFYCYRWDNPNSSVNSPQRLETLLVEYNFLRERLLKEGLFDACKEYYLLWKISGLTWYYRILPEGQKKAYELLLISELHKDLKSGIFLEDRLGEGEREVLRRVRQSDDSLKEYLREKDEQLRQIRKKLEKLQKNNVIVIFGNGNMGKLVRKFLQRRSIGVAAYMDNNKELWEKKDEGILIMRPEDGVKQFEDGTYIIANTYHYDEIENQLLKLDIPKEKMIRCFDYESLLF